MRILVTGGTGLIGRHLIDRLAGKHELVGLARDVPDDDRVQWIRQDLTEPLAGLPERIDATVHLAQSQRYRDFPEGAEDVFEVNIESTFRLLEHARRSGARSFVLASSGGLYGFPDHPVTENDRLAPANPYLRSKLIGELLARNYEKLFSTVVLRPFFVYGAGPSQMLVTRLGRRILAGEEIEIAGLPGMRLNPIHASDAAAAIATALHLDEGETLNIAGDEVVSVAELAEKLARALGRDAKLKPADGQHGGNLIADNTRMKQRLGITPSVSLDEGLALVAASLA